MNDPKQLTIHGMPNDILEKLETLSKKSIYNKKQLVIIAIRKLRLTNNDLK